MLMSKVISLDHLSALSELLCILPAGNPEIHAISPAALTRGWIRCNLRFYSLPFSAIMQRPRCLMSPATELATLPSLPAGSYGFLINTYGETMFTVKGQKNGWVIWLQKILQKIPRFVSRSSPLKVYSSIPFCCHKPLKDWSRLVFLGKKS